MGSIDLQSLVNEIADEMAEQAYRGEVADYIPPLAKVSPDHFGITIIDPEGNDFAAGDADMRFSIQSISKVFSLTMALGYIGDALWSRVGREPSGSSFNSIVQLESESGIPRNPFINSGAIVVADVINHRVEEALGTYFHFCALSMSCRQLAKAGRYLMLEGQLNSEASNTIISRQRTRRILALMMMCGHYDGSGDFAYRVGLPGKSGVGGGILAIAPGTASIAVWSPGLNAQGNSHLGRIALERLVRRTGWSVFKASN